MSGYAQQESQGYRIVQCLCALERSWFPKQKSKAVQVWRHDASVGPTRELPKANFQATSNRDSSTISPPRGKSRSIEGLSPLQRTTPHHTTKPSKSTAQHNATQHIGALMLAPKEKQRSFGVLLKQYFSKLVCTVFLTARPPPPPSQFCLDVIWLWLKTPVPR